MIRTGHPHRRSETDPNRISAAESASRVPSGVRQGPSGRTSATESYERTYGRTNAEAAFSSCKNSPTVTRARAYPKFKITDPYGPDADIDEVAVRRAAHGENLPLNRHERVEAARLIVAWGGGPGEISRRLRTNGIRARQLYTIAKTPPEPAAAEPAAKPATEPATPPHHHPGLRHLNDSGTDLYPAIAALAEMLATTPAGAYRKGQKPPCEPAS